MRKKIKTVPTEVQLFCTASLISATIFDTSFALLTFLEWQIKEVLKIILVYKRI